MLSNEENKIYKHVLNCGFIFQEYRDDGGLTCCRGEYSRARQRGGDDNGDDERKRRKI
jgi:hypothetical protein